MEEHITGVVNNIHHKVIARLGKVLNEWGTAHNWTHKKKNPLSSSHGDDEASTPHPCSAVGLWASQGAVQGRLHSPALQQHK